MMVHIPLNINPSFEYMDSAQLETVADIAADPATREGVWARNIITLVTGKDTLYYPAQITSPPAEQLMLTTKENPAITGFTKAYPVPSAGMVYIEYRLAPETKRAEIKIWDITGKEVGAKILKGNTGTVIFNLSPNAAGVYMYRLFINGKSVESHKIVLQK